MRKWFSSLLIAVAITGMTATAAGILKHLELKISKIELPAEIEFRDSLPKTLIGKLSKKELAAEEAKRGKRAKT